MRNMNKTSEINKIKGQNYFIMFTYQDLFTHEFVYTLEKKMRGILVFFF